MMRRGVRTRKMCAGAHPVRWFSVQIRPVHCMSSLKLKSSLFRGLTRSPLVIALAADESLSTLEI